MSEPGDLTATCSPWRSRPRARRASWSMSMRDARCRRRRDEVQPDRHRHRGRPRLRGADPPDGCSAPAPTTASSARRATTSTGTSGVSWVVDPIDGTVNYLYGLPHYAVSIAAARDGRGRGRRGAQPRPRGGVRRDRSVVGPPATAYPSRCGPRPPLDQALVATGFSYETDIRTRQAAAVARMLPQVARHPAPGIVRPRPVRGGRRPDATATSRRGPRLGPRSGRPGRRRGRSHLRGLDDRRRPGPRGVCPRGRLGRFRGPGQGLRIPRRRRPADGLGALLGPVLRPPGTTAAPPAFTSRLPSADNAVWNRCAQSP